MDKTTFKNQFQKKCTKVIEYKDPEPLYSNNKSNYVELGVKDINDFNCEKYRKELVFKLGLWENATWRDIRDFNYEEFKNYVIEGTLDSYNKVFKTHFAHNKDIGVLKDIHITVCEI